MSMMKGKLGLIAAIALSGGLYADNSNSLRPQDIDVTPKKKPIPNGCKRYYFNKEGECSKDYSEVHFDAMTYMNAIKKYKNWIKNLPK